MPKIVDHQARRNEISAITVELIANSGIDAATTREIVRQSGYSKGVIDYYFENKEELISGALTWANQCYESRIESMTTGLHGMQSLRKRLEGTLPLSKTARNEWRVRLVFWSMASTDPALQKQQGKRLEKALTFFENDIVAAIKNGEISNQINTSDQARRLINMTTGISCAALHNPKLYSRKFILQEIDYLIERVTQGL